MNSAAEAHEAFLDLSLLITQLADHPTPLVEASSLTSILPPQMEYLVLLPQNTITSGSLSAPQFEAVTYCCQQHELFLPDGSRAGYLIGDGAGVGKGRIISSIIFENYLRGRKRAIWVSVSNDLKNDAERDLRDIGAGNIPVHLMSKMENDEISEVSVGVIFVTYASLIDESQSSGTYRTCLKRLRQWCGQDFDGVIVLDECQQNKNVKSNKKLPTKICSAVLKLQKKLPEARVVYSCATGASNPRDMAFMARLGLYGDGTPFRGIFSTFE